MWNSEPLIIHCKYENFHKTLKLKLILIQLAVKFVNSSIFIHCVAKVRHTRSLLETRVIIKSLVHLCYPINFNWFSIWAIACFWAYVGQPHDHIDWATSMPFASINPTNPRTNPWNFGNNCSAFGGSWKTQFFWVGHFGFFFQKKKIFFLLYYIQN